MGEVRDGEEEALKDYVLAAATEADGGREKGQRSFNGAFGHLIHSLRPQRRSEGERGAARDLPRLTP